MGWTHTLTLMRNHVGRRNILPGSSKCAAPADPCIQLSDGPMTGSNPLPPFFRPRPAPARLELQKSFRRAENPVSTLLVQVCNYDDGMCFCPAGFGGLDCASPRKRPCFQMGPDKRDVSWHNDQPWAHSRCAGAWEGSYVLPFVWGLQCGA